jgi:cellulose biosynthesis protein BcsQ
VDWVAEILWTGWQHSHGLRGNIPLDWVAEIRGIRNLLFDQIESVEHGLKIQVVVLAVVPNLVQDSALSKRILSDLRANIPVATPFEIKKRVVLQEAYDKGRSIFSFKPPNSVKEHDAIELRKIYTELATFVRDQLSKM